MNGYRFNKDFIVNKHPVKFGGTWEESNLDAPTVESLELSFCYSLLEKEKFIDNPFCFYGGLGMCRQAIRLQAQKTTTEGNFLLSC